MTIIFSGRRTEAAEPIFILGAPRSFTSLICAMLGQNPGAYGMPELNLFLAETIEEFVAELSGGPRQIQIHGSLRALAHLLSGEQTMDSIDLARRWMLPRFGWKISEFYYEFCNLVAPLRIVDKSPVYTAKPEYLKRINAAFPDAFYIHLLRHPRTQGQSIMNVAKGIMVILANSVDYDTDPPTIDPQIVWHRMQSNIDEFLQGIPPQRQLRLRGEDVLNDKQKQLRLICERCDLPADDEAMEFMLHPEDSPFASVGPLGAHFGNDPNFLHSPALRDTSIAPSTLDGPLPWRADGKGFNPEVISMAKGFGYD